MKRIISILLIVAMMFTMTACGTSKTDSEEGKENSTAITETNNNSEDSNSPTNTDTADTIKIGSIQDLTSTTAVMGIALSEGIKWQVDQINANGGINGKMIELINLLRMATRTK